MMKDLGLVLGLCAAATAAGCAAGTGGGALSTAAMPDVVCSVQPLAPSQWAGQAQAALNRTLVLEGDARTPYFRTALEQARLGIEQQPDNPYHHFLAGQAAAGMGDVAAANAHLTRAAELCPELVEPEIEPVRQRAWAEAFTRGLDAFRAEDTEGAIREWETATQIWDGAPNAHFNLAVINASRGNHEAALQHYREALRIFRALPDTDNPELAAERLDTRAQGINGMIGVGAQYFQNNQYAQARDIFREVTEIEPNSRDAWYNYSLALYRLESWNDLLPVAQRVVEIDPLNYNARIILFNAHKGISDAAAAAGQAAAERASRDRALAALEAAESLPVRLDNLSVSGGAEGDPVEISGVATGTGQAGGPVTLEFTVYGASGELGTGTTSVQRPATDAEAPFTVTIPVTEPVTGWRYRVR
jgi:tetratricopeptide (TPR) repeat protein